MAAMICLKIQKTRYILCSTALNHTRIICQLSQKLSSNAKDSQSVKKSSSKYKETVLLPKTDFPLWLDPRQRAKHDEDILKNCGFATLYEWQRKAVKGEEFVLHDGPPYANGDPHVGHALNKILKDIVMRNKLLNGHCIHYIPGWDCHGLPIELKAVSDERPKDSLSPLEIRQKARKFATKAVEKQRKAFRSWGILGDWSENCYHTFDKSYVKNQLRQFFSLYEKGFVYRDMKPIYWSPSSRTALAEAELVYNKHHKSTCVTLRVSLVTKPFNVEIDGPLYALIWTTTPWTLPANEAVTYKSELEYCVVNIEHLDGHYIVASNLVPSLEKSISKKVEIVQSIPGRSLKRVTYKHPLYKEEVHKFFHADHVTDDKGTGLVHCAPAHGREDYIVAVENKMKLVSLVDKEGNYVESAGAELMGKNIMGEGAKVVQELLKTDIIHTDELEHSYPYDWRTNKPVFLLASEQWFFDCSAVRDEAVKILNHVTFAPDESYRKPMTKLVQERPFWCISRQRVWGVPIPVLFKRNCKKPIVSKALVKHYCDLIDKHGTDFWWSLSSQDILPTSLAAELDVDASEVERCQDILDIWFDSGLSWSAVLGGRTADVYLEGSDQLTGWFQSSLLTSIALYGKSPFRKIFTHGFVVDGDGLKMSKSVGNVIDPQIITKGGKNIQKEPAFGVDTLRWWAAAHGVQHANIPISLNLIKSSSETLQKLRGTIRYALGVLKDLPAELIESVPHDQFFVLDKYMLHAATELKKEVEEYYACHKYNLVCISINNFVVNDVSNLYFNVTKDRLFCDKAESESRRACQLVIHNILETLLYLTAPITPLLVEEAYSLHPVYAGKRNFFEYRSINTLRTENEWLSSCTDTCIKAALDVKLLVNKAAEGKSLWGQSVLIKASPGYLNFLKPLVENQPATSSQLTELLQVGSISLEPLSDKDEASPELKVQLSPLNKTLCARCRRHCVIEGSDVCSRCVEVLDSPLNALKHSYL